MKKKLLIALLMLVVNSFNASSQDYYHGFGGQFCYGIYHLDYTSPTESVNYTGVAVVPGAFYKATFGLADHFGISAYPFLGLSLNVNSQSGGSGSFGLSLPLAFELYAGDMDDACFIAGAGFSYTFLASTGYGSSSVVGPMGQIGGQFNFRDRLVGIRLSYTIGLNKSEIDVPNVIINKDTRSMLTLGFYYPLGQ